MTWRPQPLKPFGAIAELKNAENLELLNPKQIEKSLREHDLFLIRGAMKPQKEEFLKFCMSLPGFSSDPLQWDFGPVMELRVDTSATNYLFSSERVPFHWDGAFHKEPAVLAFHCLEAPSVEAGGQTLFANTSKILEDLSAAQFSLCEQIELEFRTEKLAHYGGTIRRPLLQTHPLSGKKILRLAEEVQTKRNPVHLSIHGASKEDGLKILAELTDMAYDPSNCYCHDWQSGDILLADNFSLIHGRNAFKENSPRWIRRVQIMHQA